MLKRNIFSSLKLLIYIGFLAALLYHKIFENKQNFLKTSNTTLHLKAFVYRQMQIFNLALSIFKAFKIPVNSFSNDMNKIQFQDSVFLWPE